jgi:hypothetical protein
VPEELAFDDAGRKRRAIYFDQELVLAPGEIVDCADDQLLTGAGLAGDEHGGIGLRHLAHAREYAEDRGGLADDVAERGFAPDLLLEVDVFLLQPRVQSRDLLVREQVLDREPHLLADREEQRPVVGPVGAAHAASNVQRSDDLSLHGHRNRDGGAESSLDESAVLEERRRFPHVGSDERRAVIEHPSVATLLLAGQFGADRKNRRQGRGPGYSENAEGLLFRIVNVERRPVERDHALERSRGRAEQRIPVEAGDDRVIDLEENALPLLRGPKLAGP